MKPDNRIFSGSVSIRIGRTRTKIDLSPAEIHGGEEGFYRVRVGRRWLDKPEGGMLFLERVGLAKLIANAALGEMMEIPDTMPELPMHSRVSVLVRNGLESFREQVFTSTPPIRGFDGQFYVGVRTCARGFVFIPVKDIVRRNENGR